MRLQGINFTGAWKGLHGFTRIYKGLQRLYKELQGYTRDLQGHGKVYMGLQGYTRDYRGYTRVYKGLHFTRDYSDMGIQENIKEYKRIQKNTLENTRKYKGMH